MIDIKRFCATNDIRQFLNQPFKLDGRVVASNGHVIIVVTDEGNNNYEELSHNRDGVLKTVKRIEAVTQWHALDKDSLTFPELSECGVCKGMGKAIKEDCEECDGEGEAVAENDFSTYHVKCASCDGEGYHSTPSDIETCPCCYGEGTVYPQWSRVSVMGRDFHSNYLRLIINEPDLQVNVNAEAGILFFKTAGAVGAINGMRT